MQHFIHDTQHGYRGSHEDAAKLIAWLMDKGYWFEASQSRGVWTITCAVCPGAMREDAFGG